MSTQDEKSHRLRVVAQLAFVHGLRLSEIAAITVAPPPRPGEIAPGLRVAETPGEWYLDVIGKGRKLRRLAVSPQTIEALIAYGESQGLPPDLTDWPRGQPLLKTLGDGAWRPRKNSPDLRQPLSTCEYSRD